MLKRKKIQLTGNRNSRINPERRRAIITTVDNSRDFTDILGKDFKFVLKEYPIYLNILTQSNQHQDIKRKQNIYAFR